MDWIGDHFEKIPLTQQDCIGIVDHQKQNLLSYTEFSHETENADKILNEQYRLFADSLQG